MVLDMQIFHGCVSTYITLLFIMYIREEINFNNDEYLSKFFYFLYHLFLLLD